MTEPRGAGGTRGAPSQLVEVVRSRIAAGLPVRRTVAGEGRLHIDRPLPFLCVYRAPSPRDDAAELARGQASYLVVPASSEHHAEVSELVHGVTAALADTCGACLLLEMWSGVDPGPEPAARRFRVITPLSHELATTAAALAGALRAMQLPMPHEVELHTGEATPPGLPPLIDDATARHGGCLVIGLEIPTIYRSVENRLYPFVHRILLRELGNALLRGFFEFTRVQTTAKPEHYQTMGRRRLVRAVKTADHELCRIGSSFDFLLDVTPVNSASAWEDFCAGGRKNPPTFRYRMLAVDPELAKRDLYQLPLERLEDPVLALLLRDKRREIDHQLSMLEDRDTERFLAGSLQLYGGVDDSLLQQAQAILASVPRDERAAAPKPRCDARELARRASAEVEHYRRAQPAAVGTVQLRDDIPSLIVSHGDLLVPVDLDVASGRVEALIQHEVGTHMVTYANGRAQPLQVFAEGLAGYEALQEGLAVFAEYVSGGFDAARLRLLAARVVAVRRLLAGASFVGVVEELTDAFGFPVRTAFNVAMRVFRGGGLTKDAIYLRGLLGLLAHLGSGGALDPLLVGKVCLERVPLVEELLLRQVVAPPALLPRWLGAEKARPCLERARAGLHPVDLVKQGLSA
jgi:uncharacterized protein (TIGR02421 family)